MQKIVMSDTETLETDEKQYFICKLIFLKKEQPDVPTSTSRVI